MGVMDGRTRVRTILEQAGLVDRVKELDETGRTAVDAANAIGCEVGAIGSSLVFMADEQPVLVLTSGAHRVDLELVSQHLGGATMRRASADEVKAATGYSIGGVAPVGHATELKILVDEDLAQHDRIWAAAGHTHAVFWSTYDELLGLTGGTPLKVA
jgi:prolyl-tRNA editing enzyme YbaK/EbsC (Cys-tRNA(Pro) deacylase)